MIDRAGKPLRYLILDDDAEGQTGMITVPGYERPRPPAGLAIKYCNLRDQTGTGNYGPYRQTKDDIDFDYDEPAPIASGDGFRRLRDEQLDCSVLYRWTDVEGDNLDSYTLATVLEWFDAAHERGLAVWSKNPLNVGGDPRLLGHEAVVGAIVEKAAGTPADMDDLRRAAGKPTLPVRFVFFGNGRAAALETKRQIEADGYVDMAVTYSSNGEYGSVEHILMPTVPQSREAPMTTPTGKDVLAFVDKCRGRYTDGPDVPKLALAIAAAFPDDRALAEYCRQAYNDMPWCGDFVGFVVSQFGVKPPMPDANGVGFFYVDRWKVFGQEIPIGQEQPGDIIGFTTSGLHHITFCAGDGYYIGGNQADAVTKTRFGAKPSFVRRMIGGTMPGTSAKPGPTPVPDAYFTGRGKGSVYSWFTGKYAWEDKGDKPNSNALGVPDDCQGISFLNIGKVGDWFEIMAPNGVRSIEQRTDTGPATWTGRLIDISAVAAETRFGYDPDTFPTDAIFKWRPIEDPAEVAGLSPQKQAVKYYQLRNQRKDEPVPNPTPAPKSQLDAEQIAATMAKLAAIADKLATIAAAVAEKKSTVDLSWLTKLFPSLATHGSLWSYVLLCALQVFGTVGTATGSTATPTGTILTMLLSGLGGSGLLSMVGRVFKVFTQTEKVT